ncbi:MAG: phosphatase PAP2 family protein [Candidatus Thermoplasmatota archaeon]|nr:phosphatase PAP2 family protein [Candidatus Thermoplasmatota archaeon]
MSWLMILAPLHIVLFVLALIFIVPKTTWKTPRVKYNKILRYHLPFLGIIILVVIVHLIEVNIIDAFTTSLIGSDMTPTIHFIEDGVVQWFSTQWTPPLLYFFVFIYIGLYPFLLWFSLLYFILVNEKKAMMNFTYAFVAIYAIALPFYLFLPITNVYTYYGGTSALDTVIPTVEQFFYATTTNNNCLPSLHVALSLLVAQTVSLTKNKRFIALAYFCAVSVICAVIYLAIHWITDVIAGVLLAFGVFYLIKRLHIGDIHDSGIKTH